jgi:hypothetical protein
MLKLVASNSTLHLVKYANTKSQFATFELNLIISAAIAEANRTSGNRRCCYRTLEYCHVHSIFFYYSDITCWLEYCVMSLKARRSLTKNLRYMFGFSNKIMIHIETYT